MSRRRNDAIGIGAFFGAGCFMYLFGLIMYLVAATIAVIVGFTVFEWLFFDVSWYNGPF